MWVYAQKPVIVSFYMTIFQRFFTLKLASENQVVFCHCDSQLIYVNDLCFG